MMQGQQSSRNKSCRRGRVILGQFPRYSTTAKRLLGSRDGQNKFRRMYGDYFVRGYTLGADAGVCVIAQFYSNSSVDKMQVKVTVKVLGFSKSAVWNESKESSDVSASLKCCGYSTLQNKSDSDETKSARGADQTRIAQMAAPYTRMVSRLKADVEKSMGAMNLVEGAVMPAARSFELCRSGLVVQLLLFPHALTQGYIDSLTSLSSLPEKASRQKAG